MINNDESMQDYVEDWVDDVLAFIFIKLEEGIPLSSPAWDDMFSESFKELDKAVGRYRLDLAIDKKKSTIIVMFVKLFLTALICGGCLYYKFRM